MLSKFRRYLKDTAYHSKREFYRQIDSWLEMGIPLPSLHFIKQKTIQFYKEKYNISNFVESGTFLGDMVEAQRTHFSNIISIELGVDLYNKAVERFSAYNHIQILQGDSGEKLNTIVEKLSQPSIFWLDGHYSAGITAKAQLNTPIYQELKSILDTSLNHIILIDDARLFDGTNDYPSIDELCLFVSKKGNWKITVADDIIRLVKSQ